MKKQEKAKFTMMASHWRKKHTCTTHIKEGNTYFRHDFAGSVIMSDMTAKYFKCKTLNNNKEMLRSEGIQKIARYPPAKSYIHNKIKEGVIIGSLIRMETQNTEETDLMEAIHDYIDELKTIGYTEEMIMAPVPVNKMKRKHRWRKRVKQILHYVQRYEMEVR